jgi:hypothetical protein
MTVRESAAWDYGKLGKMRRNLPDIGSLAEALPRGARQNAAFLLLLYVCRELLVSNDRA